MSGGASSRTLVWPRLWLLAIVEVDGVGTSTPFVCTVETGGGTMATVPLLLVSCGMTPFCEDGTAAWERARFDPSAPTCLMGPQIGQSCLRHF